MKVSEKLRSLLQEMKASDAKMQRLINNHCEELHKLVDTQKRIIEEQN